ncbi:antitoxin VapB family protein [Candidatus Woesearchaeota archaeon]|nr:antitoxin VapB family protein [Candidatus Woesearchaeota archaeon]
MALKTLTITKEAYNEINSLKKNNESFSELFKRIKKERRANNIDRFFGILKNSSVSITEMKIFLGLHH